MGLVEFIALLTAVGSVSGLVTYFLNRNMTTKTSIAGISKTNAEVAQIEYSMESQHAQQIKQWILDLKEVEAKYELDIAAKEAIIEETHKKYLDTVKMVTEAQFNLERFNRAARRVFVNMDVAYWETDKEGKIIYANGYWLNLFGLTNEAALGEGWAIAIPEEERKKMLVRWAARIQDHNEDILFFTIQNQTTGELLNVKAIYSIIHGADSEVEKIIGVTLPIT